MDSRVLFIWKWKWNWCHALRYIYIIPYALETGNMSSASPGSNEWRDKEKGKWSPYIPAASVNATECNKFLQQSHSQQQSPRIAAPGPPTARSHFPLLRALHMHPKLRSKFNANKFKLAERRLASGLQDNMSGRVHAVFMMAHRIVKWEKKKATKRERETHTHTIR